MATITVLPSLDIAIPDTYNDMNSLGIMDISQYAVVPSSGQLALEITVPTYPTINVPFTPNRLNIYKCSDLGIICGATDCCPLPDGVYTVRYTVNISPTLPYSVTGITGPIFIEKTFIRVDNIRCKWMNAFLKVDLECSCGDAEQKGYKEELKRIDLLITGSVSAASNCDVSLSNRLYQKANSMLELICCKFNMPCGDIACSICTSCQ